MPAALHTYALLAKSGFRRHATYRLALLAGITTNTVFGLIRGSLVAGVIAAAGTQVGGFDRASGLAYVWWGQALLGAVNMWAWRELADRVRSGDIAIDFARPLNLPLSYLVQDLGRAAVNLLGRAWPMLLIGFLFVRMAPPPNLTAWLLGALAILFAIMVSFCGNYLINTLAFWIIEIRGVQMVYMVVSTFFAGLFVPVSWMPTPLRVVAEHTPFPSMLQTPADILSGQARDGAALWLLAQSVLWFIAMFALAQLLTRLGRDKVVIQGG